MAIINIFVHDNPTKKLKDRKSCFQTLTIRRRRYEQDKEDAALS